MSEAKELIVIETDKFILTIKGPPYHPNWDQVYSGKEEQLAQVKAVSHYCQWVDLACFDPNQDKLLQVDGPTLNTVPFFFEWQDYEVIIEAKDGADLEFYHQNKQLREAVTPLSGNRDILTGTINFRTDVGLTKLQIREADLVLFDLQIEVFPSKIDYKDDYKQLLVEVNQEVYNLAYDFLRRTFQDMQLKQTDNVTHSEFFTILDSIFAQFKQAFRRVEKNPHHRLKEKREVKPAGKVRKINSQSIKWLKKNSRHYDQEAGRPVKCLDMDKEISYNTFENKFIKWVIEELKKRLLDFKEDYQNFHSRETDEEVLARIEEISRELDFLLQRTFLSEVGSLQKLNSLSLVLQMAPGYRELYKYFLMLKKCLSLNGELFNLSMKETWKLYEYWCFLKLNQILRKEYNLVQTTLLDIDYSGIYVTLKKGKTAKVEYENPHTGEHFQLVYNSYAGKTATTGQQPDNILSLAKEDSQVNYRFVFDAKYRLNPAQPGSRYADKYKQPGPEEDTINTMHRYRDAMLAEEEEPKRTVVGAYVLFPYHRGEEFKSHDFYQSIEEVNVGAFPFLPGNIDLVADFLTEVVEETSLSSFERNVLPQGNREYQAKVDFEQNVVVGSLRSKKQLVIMLEKNFYYLPAERIDLSGRDIKYVALYQSKRKFPESYGVRYYGQLAGCELKNRSEIPVPLNRNNGEEAYYQFKIKRWEELARVIVPEGYGIRGSHIYTNDMLLKKADTLPELSIKSLAEWRVWLELKRIKQELEVEVSNNNLVQGNKITGFKGEGVTIKLDGDQLYIELEDVVKIIEINDFLASPRQLMNEIF